MGDLGVAINYAWARVVEEGGREGGPGVPASARLGAKGTFKASGHTDLDCNCLTFKRG